MSVIFRPAHSDDVPVVAGIIDAAYEHYIPILGGKPRPMLDDHAARIGRGATYLIEEDGRALGVTSMSREDDAIEIFNIAIRPEAQGRGHLREVFAFAEAQARAAGAVRLVLYTNALMERNRAIYGHLGFVETRVEPGPGGGQRVYFERPLGIG